MKLSIVIPVLNEEEYLPNLLKFLLENTSNNTAEVIVVDGGSIDNTVEIAQNFEVKLICSESGRAKQMNRGAFEAEGDVLYFVHADTLPPSTFYEDIKEAVQQKYQLGSYRFQFDSPKLLLKLNSWFTRFPFLICRGGDQSIFIRKSLFNQLNGYDEKYVIMEEYDLIKRAKKFSKFKLIQKATKVSARKYEKNSWLKVQIANFKAFKMFNKHKDPNKIKEFYIKKLK